MKLKKSCRWRRQLIAVREGTAVNHVETTEMEGGYVMYDHMGEVGKKTTTASKGQSTTAEKKSGDTCGISGNAGLRLVAARA